MNETTTESVRLQEVSEGRFSSSNRDPEIKDEENDEEEAKRAKGARLPDEPTADERKEHMLTHSPYRQWCHHCVAGKARGARHNLLRQVRKVPTRVMDYMYMRERQREGEE